MKFSRDQQSAVTIRQVERGLVRIGADAFSVDFELTADGPVRRFSMPDIAELNETHLENLLASEPELIIIGTGWEPAFPPRELVFALARRGIGIEVMDTPAACRTFNILVSEGRRPAAMMKVRWSRRRTDQSSSESALTPWLSIMSFSVLSASI